MAKSYISIAERDAAAHDRRLKGDIRHYIYRKIDYISLAQKVGCSVYLVQKAMNTPEQLRITDLRKILNAAGMELTVNAIMPQQ